MTVADIIAPANPKASVACRCILIFWAAARASKWTLSEELRRSEGYVAGELGDCIA
jgi:hypothetical protein